MKVPVGIDAIRRNPKLYIGEYEPTGQFLGGQNWPAALSPPERDVFRLSCSPMGGFPYPQNATGSRPAFQNGAKTGRSPGWSYL